MSSLPTRLPSLRLPVAGPSRAPFIPTAPTSFASTSKTRTFASSRATKQAVAVEDVVPRGPAPTVGETIVVPLRASESASDAPGGFLSRHFSPRTSLPSRLPQSRFLIKISAPVPTTSTLPQPPQVLVHDASRDLYFRYRPRMDDEAERSGFKRLMSEVRKEGAFAKVFWAGAAAGGAEGEGVGEGLQVYLGEEVEPEKVAQEFA